MYKKLVYLFYIKIGSPPPEDWHGKGGMILKRIKALAMSADECRKVKQVISDTYHNLHHSEVYNAGRPSQKNATAIANERKIQQLIANYREAGLSYSQTMLMINMHCTKNQLHTMRQSAIVSYKKRMKRRVGPVAKCPQGSLDKKCS